VVRRLTVGSCGAVLVLGLFVAGCTPDPGPTPTVTPVPSVTSATPSPTPTENAQERQQRLDFEAAEKAYRLADLEVNRLGQAGGASKATKVLLATTVGQYLDVQVEDLKTLKENGWHTDRPLRTSVTADGGWSPKEIRLTACEDASKVKLLDRDGKEVAKDRDRRFVQKLTAVRSDGAWKISGIESTVVENFDDEAGCAL
jgi:hypothetical protein